MQTMAPLKNRELPRQWVDSSTATYVAEYQHLQIPPTRVGGLFISELG